MGGFTLLARKNWGLQIDLTALGMLLYCVVFSTGVFGQAGDAPAAIFFAVIAVLAAGFATIFILRIPRNEQVVMNRYLLIAGGTLTLSLTVFKVVYLIPLVTPNRVWNSVIAVPDVLL